MIVAQLERIGSGTFVVPNSASFARYIDEFLDETQTMFSRKTWERFEQMARSHVKPKLGALALQKLTATHLSRAYIEWCSAGLSAQTVIHHHRFVHRVLAQALREGRVRQNVAAIASKPKVSRREMRSLSIEEIERLMKTSVGTRLVPLVTIGLATGARRGELLGAKWDDVDFTRGTLSIRRALEQTKAGIAEKTPKNGRSRNIQLADAL